MEARQALAAQPGMLPAGWRVPGLALLALAALACVLAIEQWRPLASLGADLVTSAAERRVVTLADGSTLWLGARSAVDVDFSGNARRLQLRHGELTVRVAPDGHRPFGVSTTHGTARALGGRFLVRQLSDRTHVTALQQGLDVRSESGVRTRLEEQQTAEIDADGRIVQMR